MLRSFGIIGDIHGHASVLDQALRFLRGLGVEHMLAVGDVVGEHGDINACCALLQQPDVSTVRGNHDRWFLDGTMPALRSAIDESSLTPCTRQFLAGLPATREFATMVGPLLLCHGLGANDMAQLKPWDEGYALQANEDLQALLHERRYVLVAGGHTHWRMVQHFDGVTVINAGTLVPEHEPCFMAVDLTVRQVQFYDLRESSVVVPGDVSCSGDDDHRP
jgi:predicted phosphodiesterase